MNVVSAMTRNINQMGTVKFGVVPLGKCFARMGLAASKMTEPITTPPPSYPVEIR